MQARTPRIVRLGSFARAAALGLALSLSPAAHAAVTTIGPGADYPAGSADTANNGARLNVARTAGILLTAGTYDLVDFQLNVINHLSGDSNTGSVTPMLLVGPVENYTTLWVGDAFDPSFNGQQTGATYAPGAASFTLGADTTVYAGVFTTNNGTDVLAFGGGGNTDHDSSFTAPTGAGETVTGFSNPNLARSYAFELNVTDYEPYVESTNGAMSPSNNDLLQSPYLANVINSGVGTFDGDGPTGAEPKLRDGAATDTSGYGTTGTETVRASNGNSLTYEFVETNNFGFDISRIDIYHGWRDDGRDDITDFDVEFEYYGDPGVWVTVLDGGSSLPDYTSNFGRVSFIGDPVLGYIDTGVTAVRITFNSIQNGYGGLAEIDIFGNPVPAPAALPAGLLMIAGLAARRRRA